MSYLRSSMTKCMMIAGFTVLLLTTSLVSQAASLVSLETDAGQGLFATADFKTNYWRLSRYYVTQSNLNFCGIATTTMVLNALNIPAPEVRSWEPYHLFTQNNVVDETRRNLIDLEQVSRQGMTLQQLSQLIGSYGLNVAPHTSNDATVEDFRRALRQGLNNPQRMLVVNYSRPVLQQAGDGHISPIATYNSTHDRVLILDVSRYKYPPVWVSVTDLWSAISTVDAQTQTSRGYVVIESVNRD